MEGVPECGVAYTTAPTAVEYEFRRFDVRWGYKERGSVQIRLEPNNKTVALFYQNDCHGKLRMKTVPLRRFLEHIERWIMLPASKRSKKKPAE